MGGGKVEIEEIDGVGGMGGRKVEIEVVEEVEDRCGESVGGKVKGKGNI